MIYLSFIFLLFAHSPSPKKFPKNKKPDFRPVMMKPQKEINTYHKRKGESLCIANVSIVIIWTPIPATDIATTANGIVPSRIRMKRRNVPITETDQAN